MHAGRTPRTGQAGPLSSTLACQATRPPRVLRKPHAHRVQGFLYEVDENSVEPGAEEDAYDDDDETVPVPNAPPGMALYETLLIIHPTIPDMVRDQQLARYESFLVSVRAPSSTSQPVQIGPPWHVIVVRSRPACEAPCPRAGQRPFDTVAR